MTHSFLASRTFRGIKPSANATDKAIRTRLTNFVKTGTFIAHETAKHPKGFNVGGYNRYAVTFVLDNVTFNGELLVALNDSGQGMFYDIVKIKENGAGYHPIVAGANTVSNNSIRQNSEKSIEDVKNAAQNEILSKKQTAALRDRGVAGDDFLNAEDLAKEILSVGGTITEDGKAVLYHGTTAEAAAKIKESGKMVGKEPNLFFSTKKDGLILDYGKSVVEVQIPLEKLELNDIFDDELHLTMETQPNRPTNIRFSLRESIEDDVIKKYGKTYRWAETGYLLKDGSRIDMSGRKEGAPGGYRTVDHRDIFYDIDGSYGTDAMVEFMHRGNIRVMPEQPGINLQIEPTEAQYRQIQNLVETLGWKNKEFSVDFDNVNGDTIDNLYYEGNVSARKVISDIQYYLKPI